MYKRPHHQRVALALQSLNVELMGDACCYFGGGTAIALRHGEYRESVDMDFMCSDINGFRAVRQHVTTSGFGSLFGDKWPLRREPRMDQYGIRSALDVNGVPIKVEVVLEGRIRFEAPTAADHLCGVAALSDVDLAASKLLANSDRWADDAVMSAPRAVPEARPAPHGGMSRPAEPDRLMSRDIIDLAAMLPDGRIPTPALGKATGAYGDSVLRDLKKAVAHTLDREGRLERCVDAMGVDIPLEELRARLQALGAGRAGGGDRARSPSATLDP